MNNLKRVLSLGLSGVMLSGLLTVGASAADFTDADKIQHDEAVNILVALNVIAGKEDGSYFDPEGNVTRAEMAKMIAVAMQGGSDVDLGTKTEASFYDIKGHWAESYIEYCYDLGIISGRGDGSFDPSANVTGMEATKMVLSALGYNAEAYKLTGNAWAVNTDELARKTEVPLYEELSGVALNTPASRDTAAQILWNGLQSVTRKITPEKNTNTGEVTWGYGTGKQMLKERYNADIFTGTFTGNDKTSSLADEGEIVVAGTRLVTDEYGDYVTSDYSAHFPSDLDISFIGEQVKVIYKDGKDGRYGPDKKDVIYGTFVTGKTEVVNATLADVKDQKSEKTQINIDGNKYDLNWDAKKEEGTVKVVVNYCDTPVTPGEGETANILAKSGTYTFSNSALKGDADNNSVLTTALKKTTGDTLKAIIDPTTAKIDTIYVTTSKIAAVTAVNSSKISMNNGVGAIDIADNDVEEGLKKGDVVVATTLYEQDADDDGAYTIVKKAETASGEVEGYKGDGTVTVDGEKYTIYNKENMLSTIPGEDNVIVSFNDGSKQNNTYIEEEVTLYMVNGYVGAAVQTSESATNYSLITEVKKDSGANSAFSSLQLQVMNGEGTKTIITVSDDSKKTDHEDYHVGDIITYTVDKNNEAVVTIEDTINYDSVGSYSDKTKSFGASGDTLTVTSSDCVLFVQQANLSAQADTAFNMDETNHQFLVSGATWKAYTIRNLKTFTAKGKGMTAVINKDGKVVAAFVNYATGTAPSGATSNTVYGIVSNEGGRVKDYYKYTVQSNGEEYAISSKDSTLKEGNLVFFAESSDGTYADGEITVVSAGVIKDKDNKPTGFTATDVYTKELDGEDTLTYYTSLMGTAGAYKGAGQDTLALDDDCKIVYVNVEKKTSAGEDSIVPFDEVYGYKNAAIITKEESTGETVIVAIYVETSNTKNIFGGKTIAGASADDFLAMDDGIYTPVNDTFVPDGGSLNAGATDYSLIRIFKFTGLGKSATYKLTVTDSSNKDVYIESGTPTDDEAGPHFFYVTFQDHAFVGTDKDTETTNWKTGALPTGKYTYKIEASYTDSGETKTAIVSEGSFSI